MIWKGLGLVCNSESPIVVVLRCVITRFPPLRARSNACYSGSMEPAFYRGDLLFLTNPANTPYMLGDITVYKVPASDGSEIPIVHRILEIHTKCVLATWLAPSTLLSLYRPKTEAQLILTKGDNNPTDDIALYRGVQWLEQKDIVGKVRGCVILQARLDLSLTKPSSFLPYVGYATIAMVRKSHYVYTISSLTSSFRTTILSSSTR